MNMLNLVCSLLLVSGIFGAENDVGLTCSTCGTQNPGFCQNTYIYAPSLGDLVVSSCADKQDIGSFLSQNPVPVCCGEHKEYISK